ncbi:MAG TPA: hypothetical protein VK174_14775 [Chitinophagales bacterium]|nr:hypothetical protein [Chitinophagales bacterium]
MKKILALAALLVCLAQFSFAQELTKAEKKRLKDELKTYEKDLAGYKAKMEDIRATLDSNEAEIKRLKDDQAYASTKQAEQENTIATMETDLKKAKQEIALLRGESVEDADSEIVAKVQTHINNAPQKGTVYKVQIGLYKDFNINKYFDQPRFIGYEEVDGMNRYIISYFPDEEVAKSFVADVRKMGIKDAFVSKYIDGQRVYEWSKNPKYRGKPEPSTLQEAIGNK